MARSLAVLVCLAALLAVPPATAGAPLPGDETSTAIAASVGTTQYDSTDMTANPAVDPAACGEFEGFSNTMWFSYRATRSSATIVDVNSFVSPDGSTDYLAILFVYARHGSSLDLVGCNAYPATTNPAAASAARTPSPSRQRRQTYAAMIPYTRATRPAVETAAPVRSRRRAAGSLDSGTSSAMAPKTFQVPMIMMK